MGADFFRFLMGADFLTGMFYFRKGKVNYGPELLLQVNVTFFAAKILE